MAEMKDELGIIAVRLPSFRDGRNGGRAPGIELGQPVERREVNAHLGLAGSDLWTERFGLRSRDVPENGGSALPKYSECGPEAVQAEAMAAAAAAVSAATIDERQAGFVNEATFAFYASAALDL
jgi:hypothetical protein